MLSPQEFSQKIKAKYPEYQDMDDNELAKKIVTKYPEYDGQVDFGKTPDQQLAKAKARVFGDKSDSSLGGRIVNTVKGVGNSIWEGAGDAQEGSALMKAAKDREGIAQTYAQKWQKEFDAGKIDKATLVKKLASANKVLQGSKQTMNEGFSKQVAGGARAAFSPIEGLITGGLKPEVEKVGTALAGNKTVQDLARAGSAFAKENPATANYLEAGSNLIGGGVGNKVVKGLAKGTALGASKASPLIDKLAKKALDKTGNKIIDKFTGPSKGSLNKATEFLTPEVNVRNLRIAGKESLKTGKQLIEEGKRGIFTGKADKILLTPRMEEASKTLASKFNLKKESLFSLPLKIKSEVSKIAAPLRESFKQIQVPATLKKSVQDSWHATKKEQLLDYNAGKWLKEIHNTFQKDYVDKIFRQVKDDSGKFRRRNVNDIWDMAIDYDRRYDKLIESVEKGAFDPKLLQNMTHF